MQILMRIFIMERPLHYLDSAHKLTVLLLGYAASFDNIFPLLLILIT